MSLGGSFPLSYGSAGSGWFPASKSARTPTHHLTTAVSLRLCNSLHRQAALLLNSSLKDLKGILHKRDSILKQYSFVQLSNDAVSRTCSSCLCFFNGNSARKETGDEGSSSQEMSSNRSLNWTNILLTINVLLYVVQLGTQGKLMLWGAKINSQIGKGQLWRLVTSSFLHANIGHLMVNCYSLNSIGPTVENICGTRRFVTIYFVSAVASAAMSYWLCKAPAVGASGAIFGLVGSTAVFSLRHRSLLGSGTEDLKHIAKVIALNMMIGLLFRGIDNWGHLGGLLGGAAVSWFIGPAWTYVSTTKDGRRVYVDRAPIFSLTRKKGQ